MVRREEGVCTSLNFNFREWFELDNHRQMETIDDIILVQNNKVYNLQIRYHF